MTTNSRNLVLCREASTEDPLHHENEFIECDILIMDRYTPDVPAELGLLRRKAIGEKHMSTMLVRTRFLKLIRLNYSFMLKWIFVNYFDKETIIWEGIWRAHLDNEFSGKDIAFKVSWTHASWLLLSCMTVTEGLRRIDKIIGFLIRIWLVIVIMMCIDGNSKRKTSLLWSRHFVCLQKIQQIFWWTSKVYRNYSTTTQTHRRSRWRLLNFLREFRMKIEKLHPFQYVFAYIHSNKFYQTYLLPSEIISNYISIATKNAIPIDSHAPAGHNRHNPVTHESEAKNLLWISKLIHSKFLNFNSEIIVYKFKYTQKFQLFFNRSSIERWLSGRLRETRHP